MTRRDAAASDDGPTNGRVHDVRVVELPGSLAVPREGTPG
jgi:hypothetical protein